MPYIAVDIVLGMLSLALFVGTSAALLSKYAVTNAYLPARLRARRAPALVAHAVAVAAVSMAAGYLTNTRLFSPYVSDVLLFIGLLNSMVLMFQFMDARYFLAAPRLQRGLLLGTLSFVMTVVPALALIVAVTVLFVIR